MSDPVPSSTGSGDVSRERAAKDASHIGALMQSDPFNDYFMRRLNDKIEKARFSIENDEMSYEAREAKRQQLKAWKEIKQWVSKEELANCQQTVERMGRV